ncbi:MAG: hypothetical protein ACRYG4_11045, partial [Janthinobacterium lividum]
MRKSLPLFVLAAWIAVGMTATAAQAVKKRNDRLTNWRESIRPEDRERLMRLWPAWTQSKKQVADDGEADGWQAL